jgi:iron-sulfur cluster assembly accessory protein
MVTVSDRAAEALAGMLDPAAREAGKGLRLAVRRGGCAGWQYEMGVALAEEGDLVVDHRGVRVIVAADSVARLEGCEIDYADGLADSGFRVNNPKAVRSCGCGTSFEESAAERP